MRRLFRRLFKGSDKGLVDKPIDLLTPLKGMMPPILTHNQRSGQEGAFNRIKFADLGGCEESFDNDVSQAKSKDSKVKKESYNAKEKSAIKIPIPIAISDPREGANPEPGLQLLVEYNVSSPFLMLPLSQSEKNEKYYPAASSDLLKFSWKVKENKKDKADKKDEKDINPEWVPKSPFLSITTLKNLMGQIILGIEALHIKGLAHRDIKSQNILVTESNGSYHIQVCDFDSVISVDRDSEIRPVGSAQYLPPEVLAMSPTGQISDIDLSKYKKCNLKACDCYALGIVFLELLMVTKDLQQHRLLTSEILGGLLQRKKRDSKEKRETIVNKLSRLSDNIKDQKITDPTVREQPLLQLIDLIKKLIDENPETRATIESVKEHNFFDPPKDKEIKGDKTQGKTDGKEEVGMVEKPFFAQLKKEFGYRYINGFRHTSCPEKGDNSAILPAPLSKLYLKVKDLENQLKYLLNWSLKLQTNSLLDKIDQLPASEKYLERWLNFEASKECAFNKAEQILDEIKEASKNPLIKNNDVYKIKLKELQKLVNNEKKRDVFKSVTCSTRKDVYDHISAFLEAKKDFCFNPKSIPIESQNLSDADYINKLNETNTDYIKQWFEFREKNQDPKKLIKNARSTLETIHETIILATKEGDTQYCKQLEILKTVMANQLIDIENEQKILNGLYAKVKNYKGHLKQNAKSILKHIGDALKGDVVAKRYSAELISLKKRVENLNLSSAAVIATAVTTSGSVGATPLSDRKGSGLISKIAPAGHTTTGKLKTTSLDLVKLASELKSNGMNYKAKYQQSGWYGLRKHSQQSIADKLIGITESDADIVKVLQDVFANCTDGSLFKDVRNTLLKYNLATDNDTPASLSGSIAEKIAGQSPLSTTKV